MPKPDDKSWQQLQQQMAPDNDELAQQQQNISRQYGLQLVDWLLLPDVNAATHQYPAVKLVQINPDADLQAFAWGYTMSVSQLNNLNQPLKTPEQLKDLRGQWVVVPADRQRQPAGQEPSPAAEKLSQWLDGLGRGARQQDGGRAVLNQAASSINQAATAEVESWLNRGGGHARVSLNSGLNGSGQDFGLDYLYPLYSGQNDMLFTQFSGHRWNARNIANLGFGWRHMINPDLLVGSNLFYDHDLTRHHNRLGSGVELWSQRLRASANYYIPLSGWRQSNDSQLSDPKYFTLYERAARGWDVNLHAGLSDHFAANAGWFQWYGDKVDVKGSRSEASKNPHGVNLGLKWQPIPLLSLQAGQDFISNQNDNFKVGMDLSWQFGRKLSEMLDPERAQAMPSLMQSGTAFVERNNNIVLAYKEREKTWQIWFDPAELTVRAGSAPFINAVQGSSEGRTLYRSDNTALASVDSISGRVTPLQQGNVTIYAEKFTSMAASDPVSRASYQLKILPAEIAPVAGEVRIEGEALIGNTLSGHYRYQANGGEAEGATLQQWFYSDKTKDPISDGSRYTVTDKDVGKMLIYQVTPVSLSNIKGEPVQAVIQGPSQHIASLAMSVLDSGIIDANGDVKFPPGQKGRILFTAKVLDAYGNPLADRTLWWSHRNSRLGKLENNQTRTDANGQAQVILTDIGSIGSDEVIASLQSPAARQTADIEKTVVFQVVPAQLALRLETVEPLQSVVVGSGKLAFRALLNEQDGLDVENQTLHWSSDNQPAGTTATDKQGHSQAELTAPDVYGSGHWQVAVALAGQEPVPLTISLLRQESGGLHADPVTVNIGAESQVLALSGGNNGGAMHFSSDNASVVTVDASSGNMTFHKVGSAAITVRQDETATQQAPESIQVPVTVNANSTPPLIGPGMMTLYVGDQPRTIIISGGNNGGDVSFSSSDPAVVSVVKTSNTRAVVTVHDAGIATLTVSQSETATQLAPEPLSIPVTVSKTPSQALSAGPVTVNIGAESQVLAVSGGNNGGAMHFSSDNESVVTVDASSGNMTFHKVGSAAITVRQDETATQQAPESIQVPVTVNANSSPPLLGPGMMTLYVGDQPRTIIISGGNNGGDVSFSSSDPTVVSVVKTSNTRAVVTVHDMGSATLTVSQSETATQLAPEPLSIPVTVSKTPSQALSAGPVTVNIGAESQVLAVSGGNNGGAVHFSSDSESVVTVDASSGNMTFHKVGSATITVRQDETATQLAPEPLSIPVTVSKTPAQALSAAPVTVNIGAEGQVLAVSGGNNGGAVHFSSDNESVVTVDASSGNMTFHNAGGATIIVRQDETDTQLAPEPINVSVEVNKITPDPLSADDATVPLGTGPMDLVVTGGIVGEAKSFTSDNPVVVSVVPATGRMLFNGVGTAKITVSQQPTPTVSAPDDLVVNITVEKKTPQPLTGSNVSATEGSQVALDIGGGIDNAAKIFSSDNPSIATVDAAGNLTLHGVGTTQIRVNQDETLAYKAPETLILNVEVTAKPLSPLVLQGNLTGSDLMTAQYRFTVTRDGQGVQGVRVCVVPRFPNNGDGNMVMASGYTNANGVITLTFGLSGYDPLGFKGKLC